MWKVIVCLQGRYISNVFLNYFGSAISFYTGRMPSKISSTDFWAETNKESLRPEVKAKHAWLECEPKPSSAQYTAEAQNTLADPALIYPVQRLTINTGSQNCKQPKLLRFPMASLAT